VATGSDWALLRPGDPFNAGITPPRLCGRLPQDIALREAALEGGILGERVQMLLAVSARRVGIEQHEVGRCPPSEPAGVEDEEIGGRRPAIDERPRSTGESNGRDDGAHAVGHDRVGAWSSRPSGEHLAPPIPCRERERAGARRGPKNHA